MSNGTFFETNVLVYLFDRDSPAKQTRARGFFSQQAGVALTSGNDFLYAIVDGLGRLAAFSVGEGGLGILPFSQGIVAF